MCAACPYSGDPITIFWYSWVFLVPQLGFWTRFAFTGTLANCILSALCSFFKLGDLLNRAWIPAASGGMTMTSARLHVMAQYLVRLSLQAHLVALDGLIAVLGASYYMESTFAISFGISVTFTAFQHRF